MKHGDIILLAMGIMTIAGVSAWTYYLWRLERKTYRRTKSFCEKNGTGVLDKLFGTENQIKEYKLYVHESHNLATLGEGKEVVVSGFSLQRALNSYYRELRHRNPAVQFEPIAVMSVQPMRK